jgi:hypothetical protein
MPILTDHEDTNRYTAPPDNEPEEPTYSTEGILAYIKHWIPDHSSHDYTIDEVRYILQAATDCLLDKENGINTI